MPRVGFEPTRPFGHRLLRPARIPFRHLGAVDEAREGLEPSHDGFVTDLPKIFSKNFCCKSQSRTFWRPGRESNPCIRVLQTLALPLGYQAIKSAGQTVALPLRHRALFFNERESALREHILTSIGSGENAPLYSPAF